MMHAQATGLLHTIRSAAGREPEYPRSESGRCATHLYYALAIPELRRIARQWAREHKQFSTEETLDLLDALYYGESVEEKTIASLLLEYLPAQRQQIGPRHLNAWLNQLEGWAEIDSLCSGCFSAAELLADWESWQALLSRFARDPVIGKRRAALVLLTGSVRTSDIPELAACACAIIDQVGHERTALITKAVSWLLRSLVERYRERVEAYLNANSSVLPAIAIRETKNKLRTGRK